MKLNKALLILFCSSLLSFNLIGQEEVEPPASIYDSDTTYSETEYTTAEDDYKVWYHFRNSEQSNYDYRTLSPKFDSLYWKNISKDLNFDEDSNVIKKDNKQELKKTMHTPGFNLADFKYLFILLAFIILGIVIYLLLRNSHLKNQKVISNILVSFNDLDEQTLRNAKLRTPLNLALQNGDYKTAYRIKYLLVLQQLIGKNLIVYKKEKTNYDYLLQLSGTNVYEPFRMLTFNFDGIWYGELFIDKARYNELLPYFNAFEKAMGIA